MYQRLLKHNISEVLFKGKAIIITGARQTGKTTLSRKIVDEEIKKGNNAKIFDCDNPTDRMVLANKDLDFLKKLIGEAKIVFIDEGQKVENIGQTIKILVDHYKETKQVIVTGSSSFNLLSQTEESLTGRKYVYNLFPLSLEEIHPNKDMIAIGKDLETLLVYGGYPDIVKQQTLMEKQELLKGLTSSYLYQDILEFQQLKSSATLINLLKALALQVGSEVSYNELANLLDIDKKTVERYIDLLEKNFIIFRLSPYFTNKRKEISKSKKIYFYDLGIRNALINNFNFLSSRNDIGALWENFLMIERKKYAAYHKLYSNTYFWRTYNQAEVDLVEERSGKLFGFEFKWNTKKTTIRIPVYWQKYSEASYQIITPDNLTGFII